MRGAGLRAGFAFAPERTGPALGRRFADFLTDRAGRTRLAVRAGLRLEDVRAFTARRNFAMPGA